MQFKVKAARQGSGVVQFELSATDAADASRQVLERGLTLLALQPVVAWMKLPKLFEPRFSVSLFSSELLAFISAGLPQVEALETILEKERLEANRKIIGGIVKLLYEGRSLSTALEQTPDVFPPLYVALIRSSEKTGNIADALTRYISYQSQIDVIRKKIVSASIYPVVLLAMGGLVTLFLMLYVVPKFSQIYMDMGHELPFFSRVLMIAGQLIGEYRAYVIVSLVSAALGLVYLILNGGVRDWVSKQLSRIPTIGNRIHIYQLIRFYRTLGMLLKGGVPVVPALEMVSGLLHHDLRQQLTLAITSVREGKQVSDSLEKSGLTTPVAMRLLRVGERTGQLEDMADRIASYYDEDMARWIDWFTKLFEPLLMAIIGLVIGFIVVMMYFPIFELAGSIQ